MKILAIETSTSTSSVALLIKDEVKEIQKISPKRQAQTILVIIDELLKLNSLELSQIDVFAFGCGPGSFTGIRIAASVVQGLSYALNKPIVAISSLAAVAQIAHQAHGWENILVCRDARIQEVYWGVYQVKINSQREGIVSAIYEDAVINPKGLIFPEGKDWYGVGDGWEIYANSFLKKPIDIDGTLVPTAASIALLAKNKYINGEIIGNELALPVYLRDNVAKKSNIVFKNTKNK